MDKSDLYKVNPCGLRLTKGITTEMISVCHHNKSGKQSWYKHDLWGYSNEMCCVTNALLNVIPTIKMRKRSKKEFRNYIILSDSFTVHNRQSI